MRIIERDEKRAKNETLGNTNVKEMDERKRTY